MRSSLGLLHAILLRMDPEAAHSLAIAALRLAQASGLVRWLLERQLVVRDSRLQLHMWGQTFANPIGLAAGFDKNAQAIAALAALGFGYLEVGTVTPLPQRGNPRPRVFRHAREGSLQNALGFNNQGVAALRRRLLAQSPFPVPVGINIGKNRVTPLEGAGEDYEQLIERLDGLCHYFVINVSSPNTPRLRELQERAKLVELLERCRVRTAAPVLVKLAPDLEDGEAIDLATAAVEGGAAGLVLTNTTMEYSLLPEARPEGGLSGRVLRRRSFRLLQLLAREVPGSCALISVGGIDSAADVYARLRAGAALTQIYTAMVFDGPELISRLVHGLVELLDRDGVGAIEEVIGVDRHGSRPPLGAGAEPHRATSAEKPLRS